MRPSTAPPIGVILAGGLGRRLGGAKATTQLCGRPLLAHPLGALAAVLEDVVVVAKPATDLPALAVERWPEPAEPHHPLVGILAALRRAGARAVLALAADMPLVTPELLSRLATQPSGGAPAVVARSPAGPEPLAARYEPGALPLLAAADLDEPLRAAVLALGPRWLRWSDRETFFNVNTPADLRAAEDLLGRRGTQGCAPKPWENRNSGKT